MRQREALAAGVDGGLGGGARQAASVQATAQAAAAEGRRRAAVAFAVLQQPLQALHAAQLPFMLISTDSRPAAFCHGQMRA